MLLEQRIEVSCSSIEVREMESRLSIQFQTIDVSSKANSQASLCMLDDEYCSIDVQK